MSHDAHRRLQLGLILGLLAAMATNQHLTADANPPLPLPPLRAKLHLAPPRPIVVTAMPAASRDPGWAEFEATYRIAEPSPSVLLGTIQAAKYRLDEVAYGADKFLKGLSRVLEFEYREGRWKYGPTLVNENSAPRLPRVFENTKVKFDIAFAESGPYLGLRLVMPLGR